MDDDAQYLDALDELVGAFNEALYDVNVAIEHQQMRPREAFLRLASAMHGSLKMVTNKLPREWRM